MNSGELNLENALSAIAAAHKAGKISAGAVENLHTWLTKPQYATYCGEICSHIAAEKWQALDDAFWTVIPFGTAGRRGKMYPIGSNAINDRTMGESAQGLAEYVLSVICPLSFVPWRELNQGTNDKGLGTPACAIAYDTRHRSRQFAELCAEIMVANGFRVFFLDGFRPTPELSFTVRDRGCACGIMISASHNPPSDNAIKAFWSSGGQLRSPHDAGVIQCVERVTEIKRTSFAEAVATGRVIFCEHEQDQRYQAAVLAVGNHAKLNSSPDHVQISSLHVLYSPLHGVGLTSVLPILQAEGFTNVEVYQPHAKPDGDFPNVPGNVANPENAAVFDALIGHAKTSGAELVLASDPDADRIGCAARVANSEGGVDSNWKVLTGNQIGALLSDLLLRRLQVSGRLTPEHYVIKTLVTSDMICRIAEQFGIRAFGNLLTGFKWIGSKIDEVGPERFVFGFEEAHGYLAGTYARDKDGAVAAMLLAELAAECKAAGRTLHEQLDLLFRRYGCHLEHSISHTMPGADGLVKMKATMDRLRSSPPRKLGGMVVRQMRDYLRQQTIDCSAGGAATPIDDVPASDLLIFDLEPSGNRAAIRPSGTEPKLKFYLFASATPEQSTDLPAIKQHLAARLVALEADLVAAASASG